MNQFTFEARQKTVLLGFMILGIVCLGITFLPGMDDELHTRFWTNYLHNTTYFTGIAFISLFTLAAFTTAWAGWHTHIKRIWESFSLFLIPGLILMLLVIIGLWGNFHHLYHWADHEAVQADVVLKGKSSFLNKGWYTFGTLVIVGIWIYFAWKTRQLSLAEDASGKGLEDNYSHHRKMRVWYAAFLPIAGFSSAAVIWQWIMSVDAHWYSTLFAWYTGASWFVGGMALTVMVLIYLKSKGYFSIVQANHFHDMGKYIFGISIFWTYLWFSQYMLIWYGNVGEETVYFQERQENYPVLFYGNLFLNFVLPFFILMRNDTKRKFGTMFFASLLVFIGHWIDMFLMIKPGARHTAMEAIAHHGGEAGHGAADAAHGATEAAGHHTLEFLLGFSFPGLLEIGVMLGFLAGFLYFVFSRLEKASLVPGNDPYLEESGHHQVWPYID